MDEFEREMTKHYPQLRGYARGLTGDYDDAQDLFQDTILLAIQAKLSFELGTNMRAWLFCIMRNKFLSKKRSDKYRFAETIDNTWLEWNGPLIAGAQVASIQLRETLEAIDSFQEETREVVMLVAVHGYAYDEVACMTGIPIGTIKSKVARSRAKLEKLVEISDND